MKERTLVILEWLIAAAISAYACELARVHDTPVDRAVPFIAVVLVSLAFVSHRAILLSVPLLVIAELTFVFTDETMRFLAFGIICAAAIAVTRLETPFAAIAAILLLRWIPIEDVHVFRELLLLGFAAAIVFVLGRTPFAAAIGTITALITPAFPLRTLALPLLVLFVAILARVFGMPRLRFTAPSVIAVAFAVVFFAWSGIVARAWPYFLKPYREPGERVLVNWALAPNATKTFRVPDNANALIVSGANVPRFRRGVLLGTINPGAIPVRVGDTSDWGYLRRDHFYGTRNPLPRDPAGKIRGYGYTAWVDGAGRIALPRNARAITVTAAANLPKDASLQIEAFELAPR